MFGKMTNATMINTSKPLWPTFPLKCVACEATHIGNLDQAIADGWHITVYDTRTQGQIQFVGCPLHTEEWEGEGMAFLKGHRS